MSHDNRPLGLETKVTIIEHVGDRKRAEVALQRALALSRGGHEDHRTSEPAVTAEVGRALEEGVEL
ncbi:MAG: hypothetical protein ACRD0L_07520 [Acidimicrobiales bacterium]